MSRLIELLIVYRYDWDTRPYDIGIKTDNLTQRAQRYPLFEPAIELTPDEKAQQEQEDQVRLFD